jgi:hypothetical protein
MANNLEQGVQRALAAYLKERGDEDVDGKVAANLAAAVTMVTKAFEGARGRTRGELAWYDAWSDAFVELKQWALANIA